MVSLSLLDDWDMIFTHPEHVRLIAQSSRSQRLTQHTHTHTHTHTQETVTITLPRRSLLVLTSDARYEWSVS